MADAAGRAGLMLVYRDGGERIDCRNAIDGLRQRLAALPVLPSHDAATAVLIEIAEIESAVADECHPDADDLSPVTEALRQVTVAAGRLFAASSLRMSRPEDVLVALAALRGLLQRVDDRTLPRQVTRRVSEGYAYYALHPETYLAAASRFAEATRPWSVVCVGIRSIGTGLSAVVGAALERRGVPVRTFTVRPRGHPFARELRLRTGLQLALGQHSGTAHFVVADEGPGLSGSSFASAAAMLGELGVPDDRIVLFPSWNADGSTFRSARAAQQWSRHQRWTVPAVEAGAGIDTIAPREESVEWSGGAWRTDLLAQPTPWPAVHAQHERVKRRLRGESTIIRFTGLGHYGESRLRRAELLASGGYGPDPGPLCGGYLALPFVDGSPLSAHRIDADVVSLIPEYLAFLARQFPATRATSLAALHEMAALNCSEADPSLVVPPLQAFGEAALQDAPACAIDARMMVHEFIRTTRGVTKVDALDHARDHFFPGAQDIAWDLAGAEAEFQLEPAAFEQLLADFSKRVGDSGTAGRLPFYRIAYAACQLGYASLAMESIDDEPERQRFAARRTRFLTRLRKLLAR